MMRAPSISIISSPRHLTSVQTNCWVEQSVFPLRRNSGNGISTIGFSSVGYFSIRMNSIKGSGFARVGGESSVFDPENLDSLEEPIKRRTWEGGGGSSDSSSFDFLELKRELEREERGMEISEDDFVLPEISRKDDLESEETEDEGAKKIAKGKVLGNRRQMLKRSSLLAKQVICIQSACSLGFISQLWVDTKSWLVVVVEVRPNILSGENEKFLLEDVYQVGDVVLVEDESVLENELKMIGMDTLVGYNVVTSSRRNIGKVRGYTFNINSGVVESLELDSFGVSIIPSSLVSTYSLLVEDVLEVFPDTVVVHDTAISRVQRLTKGFWGAQSVGAPADDDVEEYVNLRRRRQQRGYGNNRGSRTKFRNSPSRMRETNDDWDLPMEY